MKVHCNIGRLIRKPGDINEETISYEPIFLTAIENKNHKIKNKLLYFENNKKIIFNVNKLYLLFSIVVPYDIYNHSLCKKETKYIDKILKIDDLENIKIIEGKPNCNDSVDACNTIIYIDEKYINIRAIVDGKYFESTNIWSELLEYLIFNCKILREKDFNILSRMDNLKSEVAKIKDYVNNVNFESIAKTYKIIRDGYYLCRPGRDDSFILIREGTIDSDDSYICSLFKLGRERDSIACCGQCDEDYYNEVCYEEMKEDINYAMLKYDKLEHEIHLITKFFNTLYNNKLNSFEVNAKINARILYYKLQTIIFEIWCNTYNTRFNVIKINEICNYY